MIKITEITNPELLKAARNMGFKGKVLLDETEEGSITFLSDTCAMCDEPWTVKCRMEWGGILYLCDEDLEKARDKGPIRVMIRRVDILDKSQWRLRNES